MCVVNICVRSVHVCGHGRMVYGTLVGVFVFSIIWSELLMTSDMSCPLWSSMCEYHRLECALTSPVRTEFGVLVIC